MFTPASLCARSSQLLDGRQPQESLTPRRRRSPPSQLYSVPYPPYFSHFLICTQAALSNPFSVPNLPRVAPFQPANPTAPPISTEPAPAGSSDEVLSPTATTATSPESSVSPAEFDAWKEEYSSQVAEWRRQSATMRARAEVERARWEERRAREQQEEGAGDDGQQQQQDTCASSSDWEAISHRTSTDVPAPAPPAPPPPPPPQPVAPSQVSVIRRSFLRPSETTQSHPAPPSSTDAQTTHSRPPAPAPAPAGAATAADPIGSPNWEHVSSSPTSSFPSMSFPEPSRPHSPAPRAAATAAPPPAASATLAVFDDSLPKGTRVWALITSLSVNMFLPFVNGVMLGFGEIFAKTVVVGWLGWGPAVATNVGLGVPSAGSSRRWWWQ